MFQKYVVIMIKLVFSIYGIRVKLTKEGQFVKWFITCLNIKRFIMIWSKLNTVPSN